MVSYWMFFPAKRQKKKQSGMARLVATIQLLQKTSTMVTKGTPTL